MTSHELLISPCLRNFSIKYLVCVVTTVARLQINNLHFGTSCARGGTICPRPSPPTRHAPPNRRNVAELSHAEYVPTLPLQPPYALRPRWLKRPGDHDLRSFDLESGVLVTCDVGYLCANFGLPSPLCSRLRPDVRDRQTSDVRQKHRLMPPPRDGGIISRGTN